MHAHPHACVAMLGAAPETRGSIATVIEAYRAYGLFARWPIEYLATHGEGAAARDARRAAAALGRLALLRATRSRLVVHLHTSPRGSHWQDTAFMAAAVAARCPLVLQLHGGGFERTAENPLTRFFFERAACVVVPCEALRTWVRRIARNAHVVCVPHPVVPAPAAQPGPRSSLVLFLGKLQPAKGIFDLLEAVAALRPAVPDVRLVCAGEGERFAVAHYAERLGIADAVKFTGWVGPSGKRALLESAAVFALPSYDESLPMSLLEAMAAGVPVVASSVGGIPEVVLDGVSGFLLAPGDRTTLHRLLQRLLLERELGERVGAAARESARLRFSPERTLPKLERLYESLGLGAKGVWRESRAG